MGSKSTRWIRLIYDKKELQLKGTLDGGQSFRWKQLGNGEWVGVFQSLLWILKECDEGLDFEVRSAGTEQSSGTKKPKLTQDSDETYRNTLRNYFNMDINLSENYAKWSAADPKFHLAGDDFPGIRMLNQEVTENIFSFICSSNNNISRITSMVDKLATFYGEHICAYEGEEYYAFPTVEQLSQSGVPEKLRGNGFGYRATYIAKTVTYICDNGGTQWINALKKKGYKEAKSDLMVLSGVGAKVADCICLMSLGHLEAVPVDTHVYQIAAKYYIPALQEKKVKAVTDKTYTLIGEHFRKLYGPLAGWAQTVLFCADLKKFQ